MKLGNAVAVLLAFFIGLVLSNPSQYLVTSDSHPQESVEALSNSKESYRAVDEKLIDRMCSRMNNWTYAEWAHTWWSNNTNAQLVMDGYAPRNFSANFEGAWAKVYRDQIEDLRMLCP